MGENTLHLTILGAIGKTKVDGTFWGLETDRLPLTSYSPV